MILTFCTQAPGILLELKGVRGYSAQLNSTKLPKIQPNPTILFSICNIC